MNELTMNLKLNTKTPLYEQIYRYIKEDIQSGRLSCGERLPSTRALAKHLEVSRSTVELSYEQLLSEGYIESEPCRGYFVTQIEELYHIQHHQEKEEKEVSKGPDYKYDLSPNGVDLSSFPYHVWRKLSKEVLLDDKAELFRAGNSKGEAGFRRAICDYLHQARGVVCSPEQVIVGAGSDYLFLLLSMILGRDRTIAFENPAYLQAYHMAQKIGYKTVPVLVDKQGINIKGLEESGADIAYVTPSHQYPTGIIMPMKRRAELLNWAYQQKERYIVEDDYDSEFRYKGKPIPALQGYGGQEKVIYMGTFSKSIAPAIRLGYMILPKELLKKFETTCGFMHSTVSKVDQLIVQKFIEEGHFERHLNKMRALYKTRHDALLEELRPWGKCCTVYGENAGVHILLTMEKDWKEQEFIQRAKERNIRVQGLSEYFIQPKEMKKPVILIGYANLTEEQIRKALNELKECWEMI